MKIDKSDTGFTLRQSRFPAVMGGVILVTGLCMTAFMLPFLLVFNSTRELVGMVFLIAFLAVIIGAGIHQVITHTGRHLVLDGEGIRLRRTFMKECFLPWEGVRDFGITHEDGTGRRRSQRIHYVYLSPTRLSAGGQSRVIRKSNRALSLTVSRDEIDELYGQGVMDFCETCINRGRDEWSRVAPYTSLPVNRH